MITGSSIQAMTFMAPLQIWQVFTSMLNTRGKERLFFYTSLPLPRSSSWAARSASEVLATPPKHV